MNLDIAQLANFCAQPELWIDPLNEAMQLFAIDRVPSRAAMFLATCAHESGRFVRLEENLNYSPQGLLQTWPNRFTPDAAEFYGRKPERIANHVYANRGGNGDESSGDGWRYRGRGPIQVTFRDNYERCSTATGIHFVDTPERMAESDAGSFGGAWFWDDCGANAIADEGDWLGVCGLINRGNRHKAANNQEDRNVWLRTVQSALA
jgi:putative chitinase